MRFTIRGSDPVSILGAGVGESAEYLKALSVNAYLELHGYTREELQDVIERYGVTWGNHVEKVSIELLLVIGMRIGESKL